MCEMDGHRYECECKTNNNNNIENIYLEFTEKLLNYIESLEKDNYNLTNENERLHYKLTLH